MEGCGGGGGGGNDVCCSCDWANGIIAMGAWSRRENNSDDGGGGSGGGVVAGLPAGLNGDSRPDDESVVVALALVLVLVVVGVEDMPNAIADTLL